jgi:hypothetical protein
MNCWQTDARDDGSFVPCPPYSPTLRRGHTNKPFAARRPSAGFEMRPVRTAVYKVNALVRMDIDNGTIAETLRAFSGYGEWHILGQGLRWRQYGAQFCQHDARSKRSSARLAAGV